MRRFIAENSENRLNRYDGCKTTVCTSTDSIAKRWRRERNIHTCASSYTDFTLYLKFTCVGRRRRRYPIRSLLPLCVCAVRHIRTSYNRTPSVKWLLLFLLQFAVCMQASACVSVWVCCSVNGCRAVSPSRIRIETRRFGSIARVNACVCVCLRETEKYVPLSWMAGTRKSQLAHKHSAAVLIILWVCYWIRIGYLFSRVTRWWRRTVSVAYVVAWACIRCVEQ